MEQFFPCTTYCGSIVPRDVDCASRPRIQDQRLVDKDVRAGSAVCPSRAREPGTLGLFARKAEPRSLPRGAPPSQDHAPSTVSARIPRPDNFQLLAAINLVHHFLPPYSADSTVFKRIWAHVRDPPGTARTGSLNRSWEPGMTSFTMPSPSPDPDFPHARQCMTPCPVRR